MKNYIALALVALTITTHAQDPAHATEFRKPTPGPGPDGASNPTFLVHRLGNDHAEGITTLGMNDDGLPDILSGAYWYENPGPQGGDWKQHQFRTVGIHGEFVSDCGEWTIDVNQDGFSDLVTTGWISNVSGAPAHNRLPVDGGYSNRLHIVWARPVELPTRRRSNAL